MKYSHLYLRRWTFSLLFGILLSTSALTTHAASTSAPPAPTNISCQGYERTTVALNWIDNATDETNYRVERSIAGGAFAEVATLAANSTNWSDTGIDPSVQNRRYRVRAYRATGADNFSDYSPICNNRRIYETAHFRVFYGVRGTSDDCPQIDGQDACLADVSVGGVNKYAKLAGDSLEGSVAAFHRLGFTRDAGTHATLDKIPVNVVWCDSGGCAGGGGLGLSPYLLEHTFDLTTRVGDPIAYLVGEHETFHFEQFKYGGIGGEPDGRWIVEGQARMSQDKVCIGGDRANCLAFDDVSGGYAGYVGQVNGYLATMSTSLTLAQYDAALFWAYVTERYGTSAPTDTVENGMNIIVKFWEASAATPGRDGITVLNDALTALGATARFRDVWKDFVVAAYTKNLTGTGVAPQYKFKDMAEPGGNYNPPAMQLDQPLGPTNGILLTDQTVYPWAAKYYRISPSASVPVIPIKVMQDTPSPVFYAILGIQGNNLTYIETVESRNLDRTLVNSGFSKVVVAVAGLNNLANFHISFNSTTPSLRIRIPTTTEKARVGSPSTPDKFLAAIDVVGGDGTPLGGIDPSRFTFSVGSQAVLSSSIVASSTVQGENWFVIRAPVQPASGLYNLTVRYSTILTGVQSQAIDYSPRNSADSMLVIDRSGSMGAFNKMASAKAAARLFIDSWTTTDKIGVLSFQETPSNPIDLTLRDWSNSPSGGSRQQAFDAITALNALGGTNIGDSLIAGWNELKAHGATAHDWALVLLSDGNEQDSSPVTNFAGAIDAITNAPAGTKRPVIHAIAVGPDADAPRMQQAAQRTGGTFHYVATPAGTTAASAQATAVLRLDIDSKYRYIATKMTGGQQIFSYTGPQVLDQSQQETVPFNVEQGAAELVVSLSWDASQAQGTITDSWLMNPNGQYVTPYAVDFQHTLWRIPAPSGGEWKLTATSEVIPAAANDPTSSNRPAQPSGTFMPPFLVQAEVKSDVTMDSFLATPVDQRTPGTPMVIQTMLTENRAVTGATVIASITPPNGSQVNLALYDDGAHVDGAADDGLYANTFFQTGAIGTYDVVINAAGMGASVGAFSRQDVLAFAIFATTDNPDADGDGLPDDWERTFYGDPQLYGAPDDPDHDGLPNIEELQEGTNPMDPDTDQGGEADGTDPNPLDSHDDRTQQVRLLAVAGIAKIYLRYTPKPNDQAIRIYRGATLMGPFDYLNDFPATAGMVIDDQVTNGQQYCYIAQSVSTEQALGASSAPSCATPKADPIPPYGFVLINNDAATVESLDVSLTLFASDNYSPESTGPDHFAPEAPSDSATGVRDMMISNDPNFVNSQWEVYAPSKPWHLAPSGEFATVYVKYRDGAGNESDVVSATVKITETGQGTYPNHLFLPYLRR